MMNHFEINLSNFDPRAEGYIKGLYGHKVSPGRFILDTTLSKSTILATVILEVGKVDVVDLTPEQFETLSRTHLGFYAPNPNT
jgi:hypothetical protein